MSARAGRGRYTWRGELHALTRSAFIARKPDYTKPNWKKIGLTYGTTAVLWVLLFKQHDKDVMEYERRREEREKRDACTGCS
ncbi:NADH dehydrogenase [ubiquinone] 1 subunit C1, mitochondrial isoform X3 [Mauremys reevesii]|uniref:NADH dehydrogenase [ubiquinone] 1 subunit C1, mitochondrial isoform X3 n=1 Tax=Mauremys reevesii TaxID=260615 RepID=UPI00193F75E7|nr:NADH dehydrogenase [ubiquinone] 1 subunit C1, mitochondrial isoform X3 [Mauremys reevesii]